MFRRFTFAACAALLLACAASPLASAARAAQKKNEPAAPTAEAVAETVILVHGVRERLAQVRRSGIERGRVTWA